LFFRFPKMKVCPFPSPPYFPFFYCSPCQLIAASDHPPSAPNFFCFSSRFFPIFYFLCFFLYYSFFHAPGSSPPIPPLPPLCKRPRFVFMPVARIVPPPPPTLFSHCGRCRHFGLRPNIVPSVSSPSVRPLGLGSA